MQIRSSRVELKPRNKESKERIHRIGNKEIGILLNETRKLALKTTTQNTRCKAGFVDRIGIPGFKVTLLCLILTLLIGII